MGVIIDSSAVIELERKKASWGRLAERIGDEELFMPSIVWAELQVGVHLADTVKKALRRKSKLYELQQRITILDFTREIAEVWAELFAELQKSGQPVPSNDLCVIATAVQYDYKILISSAGESHFELFRAAKVLRL